MSGAMIVAGLMTIVDAYVMLDGWKAFALRLAGSIMFLVGCDWRWLQ